MIPHSGLPHAAGASSRNLKPTFLTIPIVLVVPGRKVTVELPRDGLPGVAGDAALVGEQVLGLLVGQHERGGDVRLADQVVEDHVVVKLQVVHDDGVVNGGVGSNPEKWKRNCDDSAKSSDTFSKTDNSD